MKHLFGLLLFQVISLNNFANGKFSARLAALIKRSAASQISPSFDEVLRRENIDSCLENVLILFFQLARERSSEGFHLVSLSFKRIPPSSKWLKKKLFPCRLSMREVKRQTSLNAYFLPLLHFALKLKPSLWLGWLWVEVNWDVFEF